MVLEQSGLNLLRLLRLLASATATDQYQKQLEIRFAHTYVHVSDHFRVYGYSSFALGSTCIHERIQRPM